MKTSLHQVAIPTGAAGTTFNLTDALISGDWKGAILFGGPPTANATTTALATGFIGAVDSSGRQAVMVWAAEDATSAAPAQVYIANTECAQVFGATNNFRAGAQFSSVLSNGVALATNNNTGTANLFSAILFAGADIEFAVASSNIGANSTVITHNLTGTPDCVILLSNSGNAGLNTGAVGTASVGFYDGTNSIGLGYCPVSAANPTNVAARSNTPNMGEVISQTPTDLGNWSIGTVGATTVTISKNSGGGVTQAVILISWRHLQGAASASAFGNLTPTVTGNNVIKSGMTVPAQLWLSIPTRLTATTFTTGDTAGSFGLSAAVNNAGTTQQGAIATSFESGVSASSVAKCQTVNNQASYCLIDTGVSAAFASTVASWNSDGLTENVGTANASALARINLVYGIALTPAFLPSPSTITISGFTTGAWNTVSLSGIVPTSATGVILSLNTSASGAISNLGLRPTGNTDTWQQTAIAGCVSSTQQYRHVGLNGSLQFDAFPAAGANFTGVTLQVVGWYGSEAVFLTPTAIPFTAFTSSNFVTLNATAAGVPAGALGVIISFSTHVGQTFGVRQGNSTDNWSTFGAGANANAEIMVGLDVNGNFQVKSSAGSLIVYIVGYFPAGSNFQWNTNALTVTPTVAGSLQALTPEINGYAYMYQVVDGITYTIEATTATGLPADKCTAGSMGQAMCAFPPAANLPSLTSANIYELGYFGPLRVVAPFTPFTKTDFVVQDRLLVI